MGPAAPRWTLGDRLMKARTSAGYDQETLAKLLEIGRRSLVRYEQDDHRPTTAVLVAWAFFTEVPLEWLVGDDADPPAPAALDRRKRARSTVTRRPTFEKPGRLERHLTLAA